MSVDAFPSPCLYGFLQFMNILGFYRHFLLKYIKTTSSIMQVWRDLILIVGKVCLLAWFTGAQLSLALKDKANGCNSMNRYFWNDVLGSCTCVVYCIYVFICATVISNAVYSCFRLLFLWFYKNNLLLQIFPIKTVVEIHIVLFTKKINPSSSQTVDVLRP